MCFSEKIDYYLAKEIDGLWRQDKISWDVVSYYMIGPVICEVEKMGDGFLILFDENYIDEYSHDSVLYGVVLYAISKMVAIEMGVNTNDKYEVCKHWLSAIEATDRYFGKDNCFWNMLAYIDYDLCEMIMDKYERRWGRKREYPNPRLIYEGC